MKLYGNKKRPVKLERRDADFETEQPRAEQEWDFLDKLDSDGLADYLEQQDELEILPELTMRAPEPQAPQSEPAPQHRAPKEMPSHPADAAQRPVERPRVKREAPPAEPERSGRASAKTRGLLLCVASICIFAATLVMCIFLINKSKETYVIGREQTPSDLKYEVNVNPPLIVDDLPKVELTAPAGVNKSTTLNILLLAYDKENTRADTVMLLNVDTVTHKVRLLSIPRDTYISGKYDPPKLREVTAEATTRERGIEAIREKIKEMIGFWPDYYFVLDENVLSFALEMVDGLSFEMPSSPQYCALPAGTATLKGKNAIQLFRFNDDFTAIDTEPTRIQRSFIKKLLDKMLTQQDGQAYEENAETLITLAETDLTKNDLLYFLYLLKDHGFEPEVNTVFDGEKITVSGKSYYEVDLEDACDLLNDGFNPFPNKLLTVYQLNFRQKTGNSTDGYYTPFGPPSTTKPTEDTTDETGEETSDGEETTEPTQEPATSEPPESSSTQTPPTEGPDPTPPESSDSGAETPPESNP